MDDGAALAVARTRAGWARAAEDLFLAPLVLPGIAFGLAALMFWLHQPPSLFLLIVGASAARLNPALLESSEVLGTSPWRTFRKVLLLLIMPGVAAGAPSSPSCPRWTTCRCRFPSPRRRRACCRSTSGG